VPVNCNYSRNRVAPLNCRSYRFRIQFIQSRILKLGSDYGAKTALNCAKTAIWAISSRNLNYLDSRQSPISDVSDPGFAIREYRRPDMRVLVCSLTCYTSTRLRCDISNRRVYRKIEKYHILKNLIVSRRRKGACASTTRRPDRLRSKK